MIRIIFDFSVLYYLIPGYFRDKILDEAEKAVQGIYAFRVRQLRLGLDSTIVSKLDNKSALRMERMKKTLSEIAQKRKVTVDWKGFETWRTNMASRGKVLPLPPELAALKNTILMETPERGKTVVRHTGANLNRAFKETFSKNGSFFINLYDKQAKKQFTARGLGMGDIKPGSFNWYLLNKKPLAITRDTIFTGGSWWMNFNVGQRCILLDIYR